MNDIAIFNFDIFYKLFLIWGFGVLGFCEMETERYFCWFRLYANGQFGLKKIHIGVSHDDNQHQRRQPTTSTTTTTSTTLVQLLLHSPLSFIESLHTPPLTLHHDSSHNATLERPHHRPGSSQKGCACRHPGTGRSSARTTTTTTTAATPPIPTNT